MDLKLPEHTFDPFSTEFSHCVAEMIANELLVDPVGAHSLRALFRWFQRTKNHKQYNNNFLCRFFCYNVDWIQSCLGSQSLAPSAEARSAEGNIPVLIKPWGSEIYPPKSPYNMMNSIGGCELNGNPSSNNLMDVFECQASTNALRNGTSGHQRAKGDEGKF